MLRQAKDAGKIERGFELPPACRDNTPDRIARALSPAYEQGLLPAFPFGTDFTPVEQRLIPALMLLQSVTLPRLAVLLARGLLSSAPAPEVRDCLVRMALNHPSGAREHVEAALLKGALMTGAR